MKKLIILLMMFGSVYSQCLGDMNDDGIKDILDIVTLVNDILDGDDVCEEVDQYGCTDLIACNFDPFATIFDNSCEYVGCLCDVLTEVELWGECYNIESTTDLSLTSDEEFLQLTGEIPSVIGNLTNLTSLYLGGNNLTGEIPSEIGNLTNLTYLNLSANHLTGEIPSSIGNLTNLEWLSFSSNQLTGEIPSVIGNLTNLTSLYLGHNELTGEIPSEIGNLTNVNGLYLYFNQLTGEIPQEVCDLFEESNGGLSISHHILQGNPNLINTCE
jgi:hypothetical protein